MKKILLFLILASLLVVACNTQAPEPEVVEADQPAPEVEEETADDNEDAETEETETEEESTETAEDEETEDTADEESSSEPVDNSTAEVAADNATLENAHIVRVTKSALTPQHITIKSGDTVIWKNERASSTASAGKFLIIFNSPYRDIKMSNTQQDDKEWGHTFVGVEPGQVLRYAEGIYSFGGSVIIEE